MEAKEEFIALRWNSRRDPHVSNSFTQAASFYSRKAPVLSQQKEQRKRRTIETALVYERGLFAAFPFSQRRQETAASRPAAVS